MFSIVNGNQITISSRNNSQQLATLTTTSAESPHLPITEHVGVGKKEDNNDDGIIVVNVNHNTGDDGEVSSDDDVPLQSEDPLLVSEGDSVSDNLQPPVVAVIGKKRSSSRDTDEEPALKVSRKGSSVIPTSSVCTGAVAASGGSSSSNVIPSQLLQPGDTDDLTGTHASDDDKASSQHNISDQLTPPPAGAVTPPPQFTFQPSSPSPRSTTTSYGKVRHPDSPVVVTAHRGTRSKTKKVCPLQVILSSPPLVKEVVSLPRAPSVVDVASLSPPQVVEVATTSLVAPTSPMAPPSPPPVVEIVKHVSSSPPPKPARVTRTKKRPVDLNTSGVSHCSERSSIASTTSTRSTRTKKRKLEEQIKDTSLVVSDSEEDDADSCSVRTRISSRTSACSSVMSTSSSSKGRKLNGGKHTKAACPSPDVRTSTSKQQVQKRASLKLSPLPSDIVVAARLSSVIVTNQRVSIHEHNNISKQKQVNNDNDGDEIMVQYEGDEVFDTTEDEEEEEEEEEEEVLLVEPPRRVTRSKVRLQQEQNDLPLPTKKSQKQNPKPLQKQISAAAILKLSNNNTNKKQQQQVVGKFSPRPFSSKTGVRQLAAAYSDHVGAATTTPLASSTRHRQTGACSSTLSRVSSMSRIGPPSRATPLTNNRLKSHFTGLGGSTDSHHYKTVSRVRGATRP